MKFCDEWFRKKHKCSPLNDIKARYKLKEAAEKCKKILSANLEGNISMDCLMEDEDLHVSIKREQFEVMSAALFEKFESLFTRFKNRLANSQLTYKSIELVGGSVRIPKLQDSITKVFEISDLKKTLNFDECISQGASIMAALVSPF